VRNWQQAKFSFFFRRGMLFHFFWGHFFGWFKYLKRNNEQILDAFLQNFSWRYAQKCFTFVTNQKNRQTLEDLLPDALGIRRAKDFVQAFSFVEYLWVQQKLGNFSSLSKKRSHASGLVFKYGLPIFKMVPSSIHNFIIFNLRCKLNSSKYSLILPVNALYRFFNITFLERKKIIRLS